MRSNSYFFKLGKGTYGAGHTQITNEDVYVNHETPDFSEFERLFNEYNVLSRRLENLQQTVFYNRVVITYDLLEDFSNSASYTNFPIYYNFVNNVGRLIVDPTKILVDFRNTTVFMKDSSRTLSTNNRRFRVIGDPQPAYGNYVWYNCEYVPSVPYAYDNLGAFMANNSTWFLAYQREQVNSSGNSNVTSGNGTTVNSGIIDIGGLLSSDVTWNANAQQDSRIVMFTRPVGNSFVPFGGGRDKYRIGFNFIDINGVGSRTVVGVLDDSDNDGDGPFQISSDIIRLNSSDIRFTSSGGPIGPVGHTLVIQNEKGEISAQKRADLHEGPYSWGINHSSNSGFGMTSVQGTDNRYKRIDQVVHFKIEINTINTVNGPVNPDVGIILQNTILTPDFFTSLVYTEINPDGNGSIDTSTWAIREISGNLFEFFDRENNQPIQGINWTNGSIKIYGSYVTRARF